MRGQHISKPIEELVKEAESLVKKGVKEVMLIAQELTYYGLDIYKKRMLARPVASFVRCKRTGMDPFALCLSI
jgi:tRNA A37 methylthiotransferase MiaB